MFTFKIFIIILICLPYSLVYKILAVGLVHETVRNNRFDKYCNVHCSFVLLRKYTNRQIHIKMCQTGLKISMLWL